jgi:hypothetical protein
MGKYTKDDLKMSQKEPRVGFGAKIVTFYEIDPSTMFCFLDAPYIYAGETSFQIRDEM